MAAGGFHFLEMNPRLQVEHGITESISGLDLVQLQIRIARGETLSFVRLEQRGHAIEARVCAEDPDAGFLPAPGRIARFDPALGPGLRVDTGVAAGSQVPAAFDSLIAKVIAIGRNREEARARLAAALADFDLVIEGGATNKGWLAEVIDHPDYRKGGVDTTWLDRFNAARERDDGLAAPRAGRRFDPRLSARARRARASTSSPIRRSSRPRSVPASQGQEIDLSFAGEQYRVRVFAVGSWRYRVHLDGRVVAANLREEGAQHGAPPARRAHVPRALRPRRGGAARRGRGPRLPVRLAERGAGARCGAGDGGRDPREAGRQRQRRATPRPARSHEDGGGLRRAGDGRGHRGAGEEGRAGGGRRRDPRDRPEDRSRSECDGKARLALAELPDPLEPLFRAERRRALAAPDLAAADALPGRGAQQGDRRRARGDAPRAARLRREPGARRPARPSSSRPRCRLRSPTASAPSWPRCGTR